LLGFVDDLFDSFFGFASGLVDSTFATKLVVVGDCAGGFFDAAFDLVCLELASLLQILLWTEISC
jgi:hypothetical protein